MEPTWWRQETCAEMDGGTGCCQWVPNEEICTGWGCGEGYCAQVKDVWCPGGRGEDANPPCNDSAEGQMRLAACNSSFASNAEAINQANDGRNLTQEYSNLNNEYLSSDQCNEQDVTGCSNCESCYAQGPGFGARIPKRAPLMAIHAQVTVQTNVPLVTLKVVQRVKLVTLKDLVFGVLIQEDVQHMEIPAQAVAEEEDTKVHLNREMCCLQMQDP